MTFTPVISLLTERGRKMTLYHFANCLGLAYTPYYLTYKYSGLAEYGAFWKVKDIDLPLMNCLQVGQASLMYILTQLAKMLFLATFFPMSELEEEEGGHKFDFFNDFLRVISIEEIKVALLTYIAGNC